MGAVEKLPRDEKEGARTGNAVDGAQAGRRYRRGLRVNTVCRGLSFAFRRFLVSECL